MKRGIEYIFPLLVVLAVVFVLGYPLSYLMGYPLAKINLEDRNRWTQVRHLAAPPIDIADPTTIVFGEGVDLSQGLLVLGQALVDDPYTVSGQTVGLPDGGGEIILVDLAGDETGRVYRSADAGIEKPVYLNRRLLQPGYERPPEKPDRKRTTFSYTAPDGVFVLRGELLRPGVDYELDGNTLVLDEPAPVWLLLRNEPDWARPLRVTGDYAWADDHTLVLGQVPPAASQVQLGERIVRWAERLAGTTDGQNRTFTLAHRPLVPGDEQRQVLVGDRLLGVGGVRPQERIDGERTAFTFPQPGGLITLGGVLLQPGFDYEQEGETVTLTKTPERLSRLLQHEYLVIDPDQSQLLLAETPAAGEVVWVRQYTVYGHPKCGNSVTACFLSLPQHPVPLPHWIFTGAPAFLTKFEWNSDRNVFREVFYTARGTLMALITGGVVGLLLAALFVLIPPMERAFLPWVIASQTVPIIALVPILILILAQVGITIQASILPTAIIGGYLVFFPITVGAAKGFRSVDPLALDLMRSYAATKGQVFSKVRSYAALPFIFASFKVGAAAALVGALISETETSNAKGLGFAILGQVQAGNVADLWILFFISSLLGIFFVAAVGWIERWVAPWVRKS